MEILCRQLAVAAAIFGSLTSHAIRLLGVEAAYARACHPLSSLQLQMHRSAFLRMHMEQRLQIKRQVATLIARARRARAAVRTTPQLEAKDTEGMAMQPGTGLEVAVACLAAQVRVTFLLLALMVAPPMSLRWFAPMGRQLGVRFVAQICPAIHLRRDMWLASVRGAAHTAVLRVATALS